MRNMKTLSVVTLLVGSLAACGGDSSPAAPTTAVVAAPTPVPCTQTTVFQGAGSIPPSVLSATALPATSTSGRMDVIIDWTFASSTIGVYIVQGACSLEQFNARACTFVIRSDSGAKPRKLSAANVAPGSYSLYVANFSSQAESSSVQVFLSTPTCPAITSRPVAATSQGEPLTVNQIQGPVGRR